MKQRLEQIRFLNVTTSMLPYGIPFPVMPQSAEIMNIVDPEHDAERADRRRCRWPTRPTTRRRRSRTCLPTSDPVAARERPVATAADPPRARGRTGCCLRIVRHRADYLYVLPALGVMAARHRLPGLLHGLSLVLQHAAQSRARGQDLRRVRQLRAHPRRRQLPRGAPGTRWSGRSSRRSSHSCSASARRSRSTASSSGAACCAARCCALRDQRGRGGLRLALALPQRFRRDRGDVGGARPDRRADQLPRQSIAGDAVADRGQHLEGVPLRDDHDAGGAADGAGPAAARRPGGRRQGLAALLARHRAAPAQASSLVTVLLLLVPTSTASPSPGS